MAQGGDYTDLFEKYGRQFNVDPALLAVVAGKESSGNPKATGQPTAYGRAEGLMQIMPGNFKKMKVTDPHDAEQSIRAGAQLLAEGLDKYGDVEGAAKYYYGGPDERLHGPKTRAYASDIAARYSGGSKDQMAGGDTSQAADMSDEDILALASGKTPPGGGKPAEDMLGGSGATPANPEDMSDEEILKLATGGEGGPKPKPGQKAEDDSDLPIGDTGYYASRAQFDTHAQLVKGRAYDASKPSGSLDNPRFITPETTEADVPEGEYFVTREGELKRKGGVEAGGAGTGFVRGINDVLQSVTDISSGLTDPNNESDMRNALAANKLRYEAQHKGDPTAGAGRFTGQMVATLPAMAGLEAGAVAPILAKAGPVGEFLMGKAGQGATTGLANKIVQGGVRLGSQAAKGAQEGAAAAALTSAANEQPLSEQLKTGAVVGGVLSPAASALGTGVRRFIAGGATKGAVPAADQAAIQAKAAGLDVPVPLTQGEVTLSPRQQMFESKAEKGNLGAIPERLMAEHRQAAQEAIQGNVGAIQERVAGGQKLALGEGSQAVAERLAKMRDDMHALTDAAYKRARESGSAAMLDGKVTSDMREAILDNLKPYGSDANSVRELVERIGSEGAPTVKDLLDARKGLTAATKGVPSEKTIAAGEANRALDTFINDALDKDLILGDRSAIKDWRDALEAARKEGQAFKGNDLIETLTKRERHGEGMAMKIDPEEAVNTILGRDSIGLGKANLARDIGRLKEFLGPDSPEWNGLRSDIFLKLAKAGRGAPVAGEAETFSGQKFAKAWQTAKADHGRVLKAVFSPEEIAQIDDFADIAQRATTKVKGGDNPSNSGMLLDATVRKITDNIGKMVGTTVGAATGSLVGHAPGAAYGAGLGGGAGSAFDAFMSQIRNVQKVKKAISPPKVNPSAPSVSNNRLLARPATVGGAIALKNKITSGESPPVQ